jgi:NTP pyrophosphatase (non-canonical NTP hydrolase)
MESNEVKRRESFAEMVERLFKKMDTSELTLLHATVGLAGEAGEFLLAVLNNDEDNIPEELGDARFYMQAIFNQFGLTFAQFTHQMYVPTYLSPLNTFIIKASDVLDVSKKFWVYGKPINVDLLIENLGPVVGAYLSLLSQHNLTDELVCEKNMYKLATGPNARYPLGYSDAAAIARADKVAEEIAVEEAAAPAAAEKSPFKEIVEHSGMTPAS